MSRPGASEAEALAQLESRGVFATANKANVKAALGRLVALFAGEGGKASLCSRACVFGSTVPPVGGRPTGCHVCCAAAAETSGRKAKPVAVVKPASVVLYSLQDDRYDIVMTP